MSLSDDPPAIAIADADADADAHANTNADAAAPVPCEEPKPSDAASPALVDAAASPPVAADSEDAAPKALIVRVRGLPYSTTRAELLEFLAHVNVVADSVVFATDQRGARAGEAYVRVLAEADVQAAFALDRRPIVTAGSKGARPRYVEVFRGTERELAFAVDRNQCAKDAAAADNDARQRPPATMSRGVDHVARVRGIPFAADERDIRDFFAPLVTRAVHLVIKPSGRRSGDAFVEFASASDLERACLEYHRREMGVRYIEVFSSHTEEMKRFLGHGAAVASTSSIKIMGLPYSATDAEIVDFFRAVDARVIEIHRLAGGGDAVVDFASPSDASRAMQRHKDMLGPRYLELIRVSEDDVSDSHVLRRSRHADSADARDVRDVRDRRDYRDRSPARDGRRFGFDDRSGGDQRRFDDRRFDDRRDYDDRRRDWDYDASRAYPPPPYLPSLYPPRAAAYPAPYGAPAASASSISHFDAHAAAALTAALQSTAPRTSAPYGASYGGAPASSGLPIGYSGAVPALYPASQYSAASSAYSGASLASAQYGPSSIGGLAYGSSAPAAAHSTPSVPGYFATSQWGTR